jgi:hypothetical protein
MSEWMSNGQTIIEQEKSAPGMIQNVFKIKIME